MKKFLRKRNKSNKNKSAGGKPSGDDIPKKVPLITNKTVPEHRDEVLSSAKKFIHPLQHSKHKIVIISISIALSSIVIFFTYTTIALYALQSSSTFVYKVTQVIPFPVARVGGQFISYENYLFELRRYKHYYENQQKLDFNSDSGRQQLAEFKNRALDKVVDYSYIKDLAEQNNVSVSSDEVDEQIRLLKEQDRLGSSDQVFDDVLNDYFGWTVDEFRRYLTQELLTQKLVASLDSETTGRAEKAFSELENGSSFEKIAKKYSDDLASKNNGGKYGFTISKQNRDLTPEATSTLFNLKKGEYSEVINTGYSLEIFKLISKSGDKVEGAHILFNFKDINSYLNDMKDQQPARVYIQK